MSRLAPSLRDPALRPEGLVLPDGRDASARLAIYRNNVALAWSEALAANFPAIARLVGPAFMSAMAREFAALHPPRSPVMAEWGADLAGWLEGFTPAASLPYLPDLARLEQAARMALHAADADALTPEGIAALAPERLRPHPAARALSSRYPLLSIRAQALDLPRPTAPETGEILITRPALDLRLSIAPRGCGAVLAALARGAGLEAALDGQPDPQPILACLLAQGALYEETTDEPA